MIMVMAGKGGSGKSVTATNLALALTFAVGEDAVAIVDADLQFGDVALLLQMDPVRNLAEVARQVDDLSEARLDALLLRHESGLRVLPAPLQPAAADSVPPKAVVQVVEKMRRLYRYVVVDTGAVLDDVLLTLLDHADDVVVVVDMDLPSVKNAKVALDILRAGGYPMERMRLVVNRINSKARLDLVELERSLGLRTAAAIPSDRLVPQSVNEGVPGGGPEPPLARGAGLHRPGQALPARRGPQGFLRAGRYRLRHDSCGARPARGRHRQRQEHRRRALRLPGSSRPVGRPGRPHRAGAGGGRGRRGGPALAGGRGGGPHRPGRAWREIVFARRRGPPGAGGHHPPGHRPAAGRRRRRRVEAEVVLVEMPLPVDLLGPGLALGGGGRPRRGAPGPAAGPRA